MSHHKFLFLKKRSCNKDDDGELQKVICLWLFARNSSGFLRSGLKYGKISRQMLVQFQNGSHVAASVAVVGCTPDSQDSFVKMPFVAFHHQLVCATDHVNVVGLIELSYYIRSE